MLLRRVSITLELVFFFHEINTAWDWDMPVQVQTLLYPAILPPQTRGAIATEAIVTNHSQ